MLQQSDSLFLSTAMVEMKCPRHRCLFRLSILIFYCFFFFHQSSTIIASAMNASAPYIPKDEILLDTGSSGNSMAKDGRQWTGDIGTKFAPSPQYNGATMEVNDKSTYGVPYSTVRISRSNFTYNFPVTDGPKFIRLYFYPNSYSEFKDSDSFFSVNSGPYNLLRNFSAYLTASSLKQETLMREFYVNVEENQTLILTFTSFPTPSIDSYAFVNGIEIVSTPPNLYYTGTADMGASYVGQTNSYYQIDRSEALETMYRLNVGGPSINATDDSGLFRVWSEDDRYFKGGGVEYPDQGEVIKYSAETPAYYAPQQIYRSYRSMGRNRVMNSMKNLTWIFPVDLGFMYLVRLHFCETDPDIVDISDRQFIIYIDTQVVEYAADVIAMSGGNSIPAYRDYVVEIGPELRSTGKYNLSIDLGPRSAYTMYTDAILNGIEILKLSKTSDGSLAGPNPELPISTQSSPPAKTSTNRKTTFIAIGGGLIVGLVLLLLLLYTVFRFRRRNKYSYSSYSRKSRRFLCWGGVPSKSARTKASSLPEELCQQFSLDEIREATNNFDPGNIIGKGGFGNVYEGKISGLDGAVAIKRLNPMSRQGAREFRTEIEMLSSLRHGHLVSLIGYCNEGREMILVYEFMSNGTLCEHLYGTLNDPLSWKQRLKICIDAARGLDYLHTGAPQKVIHRDVKTTNILLDDKWVAKVSDFGLSKIGPTSMPVETMVKGTMGYLDPEYYRRQQLTDKCDVYSFGVVLLEVLCARRPLDSRLGKEEANLAHWAKLCIQKGTFDQIIDKYLIGKISPACLKKFVEIAMRCVQDQGTDRPTMADVADDLDFAKRLQENAEIAESALVDPVVLYRDLSFSSALTGSTNEHDESGVVLDSGTSTGTGTTKSDGTTSKATNSTGV